MNNRFEHEIKMGFYFLQELEAYLNSDPIKKIEEAESKLLNFQKESIDKMDELYKELDEANLKVAKLGMERGKMLSRLEKAELSLESIRNIDTKYIVGDEFKPPKDTQIISDIIEIVEDYNKKYKPTESVAEADATGRP